MKQRLPLLLMSPGGLGADAGQMQVQTDRCVGRDEAIIGNPTGFEGKKEKGYVK